jgi:hypothetical protein
MHGGMEVHMENKQRTKTMAIAQRIKKATGESLISINLKAMHLVKMGFAKNREEALRQIQGWL